MKALRGRGFTLVELMVVVVVVALLAAVALPGYQGSVRKSRRTDARIALTELAQTLERCQTQFGSFDDAACTIASPQNSVEGYYSVSLSRDASSFTLTATARGAQADDSACQTFTLDNLGVRTAADGDGSAANGCW